MTTQAFTVQQEFTPLDLLLWRHLRREVPGLVERTLDLNPGLAEHGVFLPVGTQVTVDVPAPAKQATPRVLIRLVS